MNESSTPPQYHNNFTMSSFQNSESIKQAMYEELRNILSPDTNVRKSAEERLSQLKFTEGYGVYLAEFTMNPSFDLGLRQLAAVMLKKYIESCWSAGDETQTCEQAKKMIKSVLPNGLCDPNSKIRTSVAYTISTIASHDWPNNWMELFDIIVKCLSGNEDSVHGAMQVLVEFTYDLNNQISNVGPIIISEVYRIFTADTYSLKTRSCAVDIFKQILKSISTHVLTKEEQAAILTPAIMDTFIVKMMVSLSDTRSDCLLKTSILKCFGFMLNFMPKYIQPHFNTILTPVWHLMAQTAEIYVKVIVNQTVESPYPDNDDDDEIENFTTMVLQMFEFIHSVIECGKFKTLLRNVLSDLIYVIIVYMQITEEQVERWSTDPEKFVQDEDEQSVDYSIRVSAEDVLTVIGQSVDKVIPALQDALSRHYCAAEQEKNNNNRNWWKIHEACMLAVSALDFVIEGKTEVKFNLTEYLNMSKTLMTTVNVSPFLTGRCLCLMSLFSSEISTGPLLTELLNMTCLHFSADKPIVVRICAVRAVQYFCENFKGAPMEKKELVLRKLGALFEGVFSLIGLGKYDILNLLLETIHAIISFDEAFTGSIQNKVIPLTIAIFLKHHEDRYTLELVLDLLKILSQNSYCLLPLQERIIPTLVSILNLDKEQGNNTTMQDRGLDVLTTIIRNCKAPLSDAIMESAFPAAVQCILRTEDQSVMQSGGKCIRAFIHVAPEQVCNFRDGEGLNQIMQITTMLLNPMLNTDAPSVGEMVITLIAKAGNYLGENIYLLLKAVISKLQTVNNNWDYNMNLIMIFAHLFLTQIDALLNFLGTVPGPTGEPAITFIFTNWLSHHGSFYGFYCRKVSLMALCKVFEYGVTAKDARLTSATMKVVVTNPVAAVKTRSQYANAQQVVSVPILVRILQILIAEVAHLRELQQAHLDQGGEGDSDDDEDGDSVAEQEDKLEPFHGIDSDEEDEEDDPMLKDLLNDPVMQSDFDLIKFTQNFSRDDTFKDFLVHLNQTEKDILRSIQVNV